MAALQLRSSLATMAGNVGRAAVRPGQASTAREFLREAGIVLLAWLERAHQRRQLRMLSDHMLKDIGLSRADVEAEVSKPFWLP